MNPIFLRASSLENFNKYWKSPFTRPILIPLHCVIYIVRLIISESLAQCHICFLCPFLYLNHWHNVIYVSCVHPYIWIIGTMWYMFPVSILISESLAQCDICFLCPSLYLNHWHNVIMFPVSILISESLAQCDRCTYPMSILTSESLARRGKCIICPSLLLNHWHNVLDLPYVHF